MTDVYGDPGREGAALLAGNDGWPPTAHMKRQSYSIRNCARDLITVLDKYAGNMAVAYDDAMPIVERLVAQTDLVDIGVRREGNHTPGSQWLYYDYELEIHLSTFKTGLAVPVHNHGTWELIVPFRGEFEYTSFRRLDDSSIDGVAELEIEKQGTLARGDAALCGPPPDDIHTFTAKTDDVLLLGLNHGPLAPTRAYFDVEARTYQLRDSKGWRLGLLPDSGHSR